MKAQSTTPGKGRFHSKELSLLIFLLVTFIVLLAMTFGYLTMKADHDKQYISLAGELRVLSQRIAKDAEVAASGGATFESLQQARDQSASNLTHLKQGDPANYLPPSPPKVAELLQIVDTRWSEYTASADVILANEDLLKSLGGFVNNVDAIIPQLTTTSEQLVELMIENNAAPEGILLASRAVMLSQRIASNVTRVFQSGQGSEVAAQAADVFRRDTALFEQILEDVRAGSGGLRISRLTFPEIDVKLQEITGLFEAIAQLDLLILDQFPDLFRVQDAARSLFTTSDELLAESTRLVQAYAGLEGSRKVSDITGYIFGAVALMMLIALGYKLRRDALARLAVSAEQNRQNQDAILRLLDEMGDLADGDLTVHATVTEQFTGAIADAVNYAIDALRDLVTRINETTLEVSSASQETRTTATQLAHASDRQAQQITEASRAINEMARSIAQVSANSSESAQVAQQSVTIASQGAAAVQNTIQGMNTIREQIQDTSKRIKRLGESSQEIGDIVELIDDIADQTNILALNAAIQAAMAGEAGRGFAVVADEVQRLAERSGNATKRIDALVKTIQTDANEAIISMEQNTSGVVAGGRLAQDAGQALEAIEKVSNHLAELIQNISQAAQQQAGVAASVSNTMRSSQEISAQTSRGSSATAASIGHLAGLADELRKSVEGFKLPQ